MNKYERYLIDNGMHFQVASSYGRKVDAYINWLNTQNLTPKKIKKRSQFTPFLEYCRELGNKENTINQKEIAIKKYYEFLGTKYNPAHRWKKQKREHTLPTKALTIEELNQIYDDNNPITPAQYRNRCMLGLIVFQGLMRQDIEELRIDDLDLEKGTVFIVGKRRTNSRKLKLEPHQAMHLYDYIQRHRNFLLIFKKEATDRVFISQGEGKALNNAFAKLLAQTKCQFPQIENFIHLRTTVITHWEKKEGIIEAKMKAGHRYVSSTERYQTHSYDELQEELKRIHPLENIDS